MKSKWILLITILLVLTGGILGGIAYERIRGQAPNGLFKWHPVAVIVVDGRELHLKPPAVIVDGRVYVPLNSMSQGMYTGIQSISWDNEKDMAIITTGPRLSISPPESVNGVRLEEAKAAYNVKFSKEKTRLWTQLEQEIKNNSAIKLAFPILFPMLQGYKSRYDAEMENFRRNLWAALTSEM